MVNCLVLQRWGFWPLPQFWVGKYQLLPGRTSRKIFGRSRKIGATNVITLSLGKVPNVVHGVNCECNLQKFRGVSFFVRSLPRNFFASQIHVHQHHRRPLGLLYLWHTGKTISPFPADGTFMTMHQSNRVRFSQTIPRRSIALTLSEPLPWVEVSFWHRKVCVCFWSGTYR